MAADQFIGHAATTTEGPPVPGPERLLLVFMVGYTFVTQLRP